MEVIMDTNGLNKPCACGSGKDAGACCKKDEACSCGSGKKAGVCCSKEIPPTPKK